MTKRSHTFRHHNHHNQAKDLVKDLHFSWAIFSFGMLVLGFLTGLFIGMVIYG